MKMPKEVGVGNIDRRQREKEILPELVVFQCFVTGASRSGFPQVPRLPFSKSFLVKSPL